MKIKTKKQLNLPQLIEWAWDNGIDSRTFTSPKGGDITFDEHGDVVDVYSINHNDTFTVEITEEITLTTPLPDMLHVWKTGILGTEIKEVENKSIASQYTVCSTEFWLKQDDEMTLIWRDGKLVG